MLTDMPNLTIGRVVTYFLIIHCCTVGVFAQRAATLQSKAEAGDLVAANELGVLYRLGDGVPKDPAQALKWFQKAAAGGLPDAMFNIGTSYYNGDGVGIDDALAFGWFALAAEFGSKAGVGALQRGSSELKPDRQAEGLVRAALLLRKGTEVPKKADLAIELLNRATALGGWNAEVILAMIYLNGDGIDADPPKAWTHCSHAAEHNYPPAMVCSAYLLRTGKGVAVDNAGAMNWYWKAANCGDSNALYALGQIYEQGEGVQVDKVQALALYAMASKTNKNAEERGLALKASLTDKDVRKAARKENALADKVFKSKCTQ